MISEAGRMKWHDLRRRGVLALVLQWSQAEGMLDCVIAKIFCEFLFSH
jgi:hypothetical protein